MSFPRFYLFSCLLRYPLLFIGVEKDERCVLSGERSGRWFMTFPKNINKLFIRNLLWIKFNLYCFRMISKAVVGWVLFCSSCIAYLGSQYTFNMPEPGIRPPESPKGKGCPLCFDPFLFLHICCIVFVCHTCISCSHFFLLQ